jgi:CRP/FNR family cyclic AMP-dependent transcriptional regulator
MNTDDQTPGHGELTDARPAPPQAAGDMEHAGSTEADAAPDPLPDEITAGPPQRGSSEKGPDGGFWDLLSQAERAALQALGQISVFRAGDTICAEGEEATDVLVLTEGWVKIMSVTRKRHEVVLALRGRGDIVGELAGNSAGSRTATVVAIGLVQAVVVTHDRFTQFLDSNPGADRAYRHVVTQRWYEVADMLRSRSVNTGAQRLAGLLLDLSNRHGTPAESGTVITIPLSQEEIASLIGTSRATVTRALGNWRRRGLIDTARHQITIKSTPGLRSTADRDTGSPAALPGR